MALVGAERVAMLPSIHARSHLKRYRQISGILARHGLGWVALELGLGDLIPFQRGLLGHPRMKH
ncbi:MAG: hypothetical protein HY326_13855 [Chloroflexi bacterium]|nr:hypothetical protein [Chloroflexota bacterium]